MAVEVEFQKLFYSLLVSVTQVLGFSFSVAVTTEGQPHTASYTPRVPHGLAVGSNNNPSLLN